MALIELEKLSINNFWEKTPTPLKYILIIVLIVAGSYFLFSKSVSIAQIKQLDKIEESIQTTYTLLRQFEEFEKTQYDYNDQTLSYLKNVYSLVEELNDNTNKKLDMILSAGGKNTGDILEKLTLLNESFEKLQKAYTPEVIKNPVVVIERPAATEIPIDVTITKIKK